MTSFSSHRPVMLQELLAALEPRDGSIYIDCTFGRGGFCTALLESARCTVWALDRDPDAIEAGKPLLRKFPERFFLTRAKFGNLETLFPPCGLSAPDDKVHGVVFDLGVSSPQLDDPKRGFSIRNCGPLDMRMAIDADREKSAQVLLAELSEQELARIFRLFGEEPRARRIARHIVSERVHSPITGTCRLVEIVRKATYPNRHRTMEAATRVFQALRIAINNELQELKKGLCAAGSLLAPGGRLAVLSFHSLEDRIVKQFFRPESGVAVSRHTPYVAPLPARQFRLLHRRVVRPRAREVAENPRSRCARLRVAERLAS